MRRRGEGRRAQPASESTLQLQQQCAQSPALGGDAGDAADAADAAASSVGHSFRSHALFSAASGMMGSSSPDAADTSWQTRRDANHLKARREASPPLFHARGASQLHSPFLSGRAALFRLVLSFLACSSPWPRPVSFHLPTAA